MSELVRMPEVLAGATEAVIEKWLVTKGDSVSIGQSLAEIETDKATVELAAESDGTIGRLLVSEGTNVAVGDAILVLLHEGETEDAIDEALAAVGLGSTTGPAAAAANVAVGAQTPIPEIAPDTTASTEAADSRLFASPIVRKLAAQSGVSLSALNGTGPGGRIVRRDFERYMTNSDAEIAAAEIAASPSAVTTEVGPGSATDSTAVFSDIPLSRMRTAIARRLTESKSTVPHFYLVADCRADELLELRAAVNDGASRKVSVNDFVIKAVAGALTEVPAANAIWNTDSIRHFTTVDISVAVAIDDGLVTPVVRGVESLTLSQLSASIAELAERGRRGGLKQHELEGGSFAVSNLGMYGTTEFSAILNPPQSGILAVGAARAMPVVDGNGELAVGTVMTVTLSADHRVLDGAIAAQWLAAFQRRIENPLTILI